MSFSEPKLENPATKFIDFKDGKFQYYNKTDEKNVIIDLPIYFIVLDELSTISGFCEKTKSGIYSNEVHRITDELLNVRTFKGGEQIVGLYKDISDAIARIGGKFTKSVYAMLIDEVGNKELVNFKFRGAAFAGWLDKKFNPERFSVGITETYEATKGKTVYQVPVFKPFQLSKEMIAEATAMDKQLQVYLRAYKVTQAEKDTVKDEPITVKAEETTEEISVADGKWHGTTEKKSGKIIVKAMSDPAELDPSYIPEINPDDLPY